MAAAAAALGATSSLSVHPYTQAAGRNWHTQSYSRPPSAAATSGCLIIPKLSWSQLRGGGTRVAVGAGGRGRLGACRPPNSAPSTLPPPSAAPLSSPQPRMQICLNAAPHALQNNQVCVPCRRRQLARHLRHGAGRRRGSRRAKHRALPAGRGAPATLHTSLKQAAHADAGQPSPARLSSPATGPARAGRCRC